jgi:hypothetical protein
LQNPAVSKPAVLDVIGAHKTRFGLRELLNAAYQQDPNEKAALFKIAGDLVDADSVDELVSRVDGKDTIARTHIIALLARFDSPKVHIALQRTLKDPNKLVRRRRCVRSRTARDRSTRPSSHRSCATPSSTCATPRSSSSAAASIPTPSAT